MPRNRSSRNNNASSQSRQIKNLRRQLSKCQKEKWVFFNSVMGFVPSTNCTLPDLRADAKMCVRNFATNAAKLGMNGVPDTFDWELPDNVEQFQYFGLMMSKVWPASFTHRDAMRFLDNIASASRAGTPGMLESVQDYVGSNEDETWRKNTQDIREATTREEKKAARKDRRQDFWDFDGDGDTNAFNGRDWGAMFRKRRG